jgi:uncharacterized protein (UPF0335 family)
MTQKGHNLSRDMLKSYVQRLEKLNEEKAAIAGDIKDVMAEAKGNGLCPKALRTILKERKQDQTEREEHEHIVQTFRIALGMAPELDEEDSDAE